LNHDNIWRNLKWYYYVKMPYEKATYYIIPITWYSGKCYAVEIVKAFVATKHGGRNGWMDGWKTFSAL
jgi:hypothetical protein